MTSNSQSPIQNIHNWLAGICRNKGITIFSKPQPDIDKIYLWAKDPYEAKYQLLINKCKSAGLKHYNDSKVFVEYSNDMDDLDENIDEYNRSKKCKNIDLT